MTYTSNGGGAVPATMVRPAAARGALPAVIVIHEAWGPDAHIQDIADRIATAGYLALVPDLYAHGGRRPAALAADRIDALKRFTDTLPAGGLRDADVRAHALEELP
ncbi:MAG: dienelactone hydrolase family protein, partial [Gaiellales bacterium]